MRLTLSDFLWVQSEWNEAKMGWDGSQTVVPDSWSFQCPKEERRGQKDLSVREVNAEMGVNAINEHMEKTTNLTFEGRGTS